MFTVFTEISLIGQSRGSVKYSVPVFKRGSETPSNMWKEYAERMRAIRKFVRQAPRPLGEDEDVAPSSNENTPPEAAETPVPPRTESKPAEKVVSMATGSENEDDLPF
jgi:hypothetical protein